MWELPHLTTLLPLKPVTEIALHLPTVRVLYPTKSSKVNFYQQWTPTKTWTTWFLSHIGEGHTEQMNWSQVQTCVLLTQWRCFMCGDIATPRSWKKANTSVSGVQYDVITLSYVGFKHVVKKFKWREPKKLAWGSAIRKSVHSRFKNLLPPYPDRLWAPFHLPAAGYQGLFLRG